MFTNRRGRERRDNTSAFSPRLPTYVTGCPLRIGHPQHKIKKAPGTDGIHPLILQQLPAETLAYITKLYKRCVLLGYTPTRWKECKIVFIPILGKGYYFPKALEKLCCWHIDEKIGLNPIHTRQHGLRNTDTSISNVVNNIETHIHHEQHVLAVFLDLGVPGEMLILSGKSFLLPKERTCFKLHEHAKNIRKKVLVSDKGKNTEWCTDFCAAGRQPLEIQYNI